MELALRGKVALITGASRGIGQGIALVFANEGRDLLLTARDHKALEETAAQVRAKGRKAAVLALDLTAEGSAEILTNAARREFGRLDNLINNAGVTKRGDFLAFTDTDWQDGFALKFFAHVRMARAAWPMLKASGGSLITIAGIGGKQPEAEFAIGSSVNSACVSFSKARADLGKKDGVHVNAINPGRVETERLWLRLRGEIEHSGRDEKSVREEFRRKFNISRFGSIDDLAGLIAFIVSSRGRWLHGATIDMDGGEVRSV